MAEYLRPTLSSVSGARADDLADLMRGPARQVLPEVRAARSACREVQVWGWHADNQRRRDALVAYADALVEQVEDVSQRGETWFRPDAGLRRLRARAGLA
jgi:hypothetical protein